MRKLFMLIIALFAGAVLAGPPSALQARQWLSDGSSTVSLDIINPTGNGLFWFDTSKTLRWVEVGSGLSIASGVLSATGGTAPTWSTLTGKPGWTGVFDGSYATLTGVPSTFAPAAHNQAWSTITSTPNTLAGYGITDAYPLAGNPSSFLTGITSGQVTAALGFTPYSDSNPTGYITSSALATYLTSATAASTYATQAALSSGLAGKFSTPAGTTSQYVRGDGSLATLPSPGSGTVTSVVAGAGLSGGTITTSGTISMPNTGTAGTYSGVTTDAQGRVTAGTVRSFSYVTRSLNTCFQVSATRDALVNYSVDIATSLSLTTGQQGTVYLRIYTNSGCTNGAQEITRFVNGNTGTLTIGLALTQNVTGTLGGVIPAGSYAQLVTENNTGTPTFTARPGQEMQF